MDEAFRRLHALIVELAPVGVDMTQLTDDMSGMRTSLTAVEIEAPVEIDVATDAAGHLTVGTTPPLYSERTSWLPSYHSIRVRIEATRA